MWEEQPATPAPSSSGKKSLNKKLFLYGGIGILIIALVAVSAYFYLQYQSAQKLLSGNASAQQVTELVAKVAKLVDLPTDEKPQLASVTDKIKLMTQPFFAKAENGDQVLIFPKNHEAILYRPSTNKIINLATGVTIGNSNAQAATNPNSASPAVAGASTAPTETTAPSPTTAPTQAKKIVPSTAPTEAVSPTATQ